MCRFHLDRIIYAKGLCEACYRKRVRRLASVRKYYKLSPEHFSFLEAQANGHCIICKKSVKSLVVDHDHSHHPVTPSYGCPLCVRGLICANCNIAMGVVRDNPETLDNMAAYLRQSKPFAHFEVF